MGRYVKKTNRRRYEEREFSIRAIHRDEPDLHKLAQVLIRLTLTEVGRSRAERRANEVPTTYRSVSDEGFRPADDSCPSSEVQSE